MAEQYAKGYAWNWVYDGMSYRELLDEVRFIIVPMVNPDGVTLAQLGEDYASESVSAMPLTDDYNSGLHSWKANINGVDLNRNYPYNWTAVNDGKNVYEPASAF